MALVKDKTKYKEEKNRINNLLYTIQTEQELKTTLTTALEKGLFNRSINITRKLLSEIYVLNKRFLQRQEEKSKLKQEDKKVEFIPSLQQRLKRSRLLAWIHGILSYPFSSTWSSKMAGGFLVRCLTNSDSGQIVKINLNGFFKHFLACVWEGDSKSQISNYFISMTSDNPNEGVLRVLSKGKETPWIQKVRTNPESFVDVAEFVECINFWKKQNEISTSPSDYIHFDFIEEHYPKLAKRFLNQSIPVILNNYTWTQELVAYITEASVGAKHEVPQLHMSSINTSYGKDISDDFLRDSVFKDTIFMNKEYANSYPYSEMVKQIHDSSKKGYTQKEESFFHTTLGMVLNKIKDNKFDLNLLSTSPYNSILCTPFNSEALELGQTISEKYNSMNKNQKTHFINSYKFIGKSFGYLMNDDFLSKQVKLKNWIDIEEAELKKKLKKLDKDGKIELPVGFEFQYTHTQFKKLQYTHSDYHLLNWMLITSLGFLFNHRDVKNLDAIKVQEIFVTILNKFKSNWHTFITNEDKISLYSSTKQYEDFKKTYNRNPNSIIELLLNSTWDINILSIALVNFYQTEVLADVKSIYVDNVANQKLRSSFETDLGSDDIRVDDFEIYNPYGILIKWRGIDMGHPLRKILGGDMTRIDVIFEDRTLNQNSAKERDINKDAQKYEYILYKVHQKKIDDVIASIPNWSKISISDDSLLSDEERENKKRVEIEQFRFKCFAKYITWKYEDRNKLREIINWGETTCGDCKYSWSYLIDPPQEYIDTLESFI